MAQKIAHHTDDKRFLVFAEDSLQGRVVNAQTASRICATDLTSVIVEVDASMVDSLQEILDINQFLEIK